MKNLILICGGQSPEHEISIQSAKNILKALDRNKYHIQVIGISKKGKWSLLDVEDLAEQVLEEGNEVTITSGHKNCFHANGHSLGPVDVVLPILHGPNGEDGAIQGLLQLLKVPYVGSGVLSSAIAMDKDMAKKILKHSGLNVAEWILIRKESPIPEYETITRRLGREVFVKPANMGSSIGIARVTKKKQWKQAVEQALGYDRKVLAESSIVGRELECAVKGNRNPSVSGVGEIISGNIYSYDQKYTDGSSAKTIIPANVTPRELERLKATALKAYQALECEGMSRVDMFLVSEGEIYVNEVNTLPGFTNISMYPMLWKQEGIPYVNLLDELILLALDSRT